MDLHDGSDDDDGDGYVVGNDHVHVDDDDVFFCVVEVKHNQNSEKMNHGEVRDKHSQDVVV